MSIKAKSSKVPSPAARKSAANVQPKKAVAKAAFAEHHHDRMVRIDHLNPKLAELILSENPALKATGLVDSRTLAQYKMRQIQDILVEEHGELSSLDKQVAATIAERGTISTNVAEHFSEKQTFGENVADKIATFGGSWTFILSFLGFLGVWITLNVVHLLGGGFDPYPFILLNLILSCIAALQAPVIMMSQNRQEAKDRLRSENDYQINLKAELEIRLLHDKLEHLIARLDQAVK